MKSDTPHILLVNPWIHDFAAYDFWAKPLGLLNLASILSDHGVFVSYIDCLDRFHSKASKADPKARYGRGPYLKTRIIKPEMLWDVQRNFSRYGIKKQWLNEDLLRIPKPDLILVTSLMTYWYPGVQEVIGMMKTHFPGAPVVLGGIYATLCRDHAISNSGADMVISGPGEKHLFTIIENYTGFSLHPNFDLDDFDAYPYPALELQGKINYVPLLTSKGCPFACAYCASHILYPERKRRSPESVLEEIRYWHKQHGVIDFAFYDDALLVDPETHAVPLLEEIIRSGLNLRFHTPNAIHVRGVSIQTAKLMFRAGFKTLRLGLETTGFSNRKQIDIKLTEDDFMRSVVCLKNAGFTQNQVGAYLLVGLPGQSIESVAESIKSVKSSGITPILAYYSPIPHTAMWKTAVEASRYNLDADPIFTNNAIFPCQKEPFNWRTITYLKNLVKM
ncbi:MAG: B12-binding domain-containing radical SAM protein [Deltaproteobacteria bacterium]|nr:B12-binding domain-containing radical SAM protein [Deltaproteobacteria bacterium]